MPRKQTRSSQSSRSRGHRPGEKKSPLVPILIAVAVIAVVGVAVWLLTRSTGYQFSRAHLDKYVELTQPQVGEMEPGASVYLDMSDGMISAYATPESKRVLQAVIDKLAANPAIQFNGLAAGQISDLSGKTHTELYNYMLNPASYDKQQAPIESTLARILEARQPAVLMTDYEEYNGGLIQQAAYAKRYFIDWLAQGYNITFYKWDFTEKGKAKHMFITVFDDNGNALNGLVADAIANIPHDAISIFVLGARDFAYPMSCSYPSMKQGGNYHNAAGQDAVTAVMEQGGAEDYTMYTGTLASANGNGAFLSLNNLTGTLAEFYPLGVTWTDAIANAKAMQEEGVPAEDRFSHLLSNLYVDFGAQSGYTIDAVEVRVFDMQAAMEAIGADIDAGTEVDIKAVEDSAMPEVNEVLTAGMADTPGRIGWKHIFVDFDSKFTGQSLGTNPATDLVRANIVISAATPNVDAAMEFFGWEGNNSLANSVKEALTAQSSSPVGRVLYTYYIKTLAE